VRWSSSVPSVCDNVVYTSATWPSECWYGVNCTRIKKVSAPSFHLHQADHYKTATGVKKELQAGYLSVGSTRYVTNKCHWNCIARKASCKYLKFLFYASFFPRSTPTSFQSMPFVHRFADLRRVSLRREFVRTNGMRDLGGERFHQTTQLQTALGCDLQGAPGCLSLAWAISKFALPP